MAALWGALAGSLVASRTADMFGRRPVIIAAAVLFLLGALEQAAAQVYKEVILGQWRSFPPLLGADKLRLTETDSILYQEECWSASESA